MPPGLRWRRRGPSWPAYTPSGAVAMMMSKRRARLARDAVEQFGSCARAVERICPLVRTRPARVEPAMCREGSSRANGQRADLLYTDRAAHLAVAQRRKCLVVAQVVLWTACLVHAGDSASSALCDPVSEWVFATAFGREAYPDARWAAAAGGPCTLCRDSDCRRRRLRTRAAPPRAAWRLQGGARSTVHFASALWLALEQDVSYSLFGRRSEQPGAARSAGGERSYRG